MTNKDLTETEIPTGADPFAVFEGWLQDAQASEPNDANAVAVASVDPDGLPNVRMVLLKGVDSRGFVFYTNFESAKGREVLASRKAAMCFHWKSLRRQVRVRGPVDIVGDAEADAYFASRARGSRIGAWASDQSRPLASRQLLEERVAAVGDRYGETGEVPRPPHWSGFRIVPSEIEFWRDRTFRLHDRIVYRRRAPEEAWTVTRLFP
ncbi:pyridoxamine 5'-phosphate oxidase [Mangrovibrevibacter kandeliae]|uniref:pyridoxamine 5'-phosphate oxidase n=1 Tax=Mangrovibrevibacter kandeliae TaxID=2968473 RepID=UPI00211792F5|nr:pyridoxamine 5'-phosphate oxidase [Aurantimonas sp. CSK15Z-1]MCQ8780721.1 pyridoxamine 5'-phosphate oxidase [Aurantimonas sp. CSK15Z-1]